MYYLCLQARPPTAILGEPRTQPCFPPRHDPSVAASYHMTFETLHQGKRSAWEESRYHPQFINLACYAPFRPAGGGIVTVIMLGFSELGAHTGTPGDTGRPCKLHTETPFRNYMLNIDSAKRSRSSGRLKTSDRGAPKAPTAG